VLSVIFNVCLSEVCLSTFPAMDTLDADGKRLGIEGRYAERDIVQVSSLLIKP